jgi:hypothetical protein
MLRQSTVWMGRSLAGLVVALATFGATVGADDSVGIVRISDRKAPVVRGQSPDIPLAPPVEQEPAIQPAAGEIQQISGPCTTSPGQCQSGNCPNVTYGPVVYDDSCRMRRGRCGNPDCRECRGGLCSDGWLRRKLGYFWCTGSCGQGTPLIGKYNMVYPDNPNYFDSRDGYIYSSQVFNAPTGVPLAPVVHHTYNYGWGVPSSRLTPVSHPNHSY